MGGMCPCGRGTVGHCDPSEFDKLILDIKDEPRLVVMIPPRYSMSMSLEEWLEWLKYQS